MTHEEIQKVRDELIAASSIPGHPTQTNKIRRLNEIARQVGAKPIERIRSMEPESTVAALVEQIHQAIQTASMVNMCESAAKGYNIAEEATKTGASSVRMSMWIALASTAAAWAAVIVGIITAGAK